MGATCNLDRGRGNAFSIEIKPILLPVRCPTFLKSVNPLGGRHAESSKRQYYGANTDVRLRAFPNMPTVRTRKNRGTDVALGSNSVECCVQLIAQLDDRVERHATVPLGAQPLNHFWKPYSLRVTCSHA
jgi:hypothetical protein